MWSNSLKFAFRNLWRRKLFSFINISGLALGLAFCGLIAIFIYDEWRVDKTQPDNLYRVITAYTSKDLGQASLNTVGRALPAAIKQEIPEVDKLITVRSGFQTIKHQNEYFYEKIVYVGEDFLKAFNYPLIAGNADNAFKEPYSIAISEQIAFKYFGNTDVIGKVLPFNDTLPCKITAVIKKTAPSHFDFDILLSFATFKALGGDMNQWFTWDMTCYVTLKKGVDFNKAEQKISALSMRHNSAEYMNVGYNVGHKLEKVKDIYLHSQLGSINKATGKVRQLYIFGLVGLALLLLACINFINLTTAYQSERAKEVGIRKTIGASAFALIRQFAVETFVMVLLAALLSLGLIYFLLPYIGSIAEKEFSMQLLSEPAVIVIGIALVFLTGLLAGWYPSLLLSRLQPMQSIRIQKSNRGQGPLLRKVLVIFQFAISIILITGTIIAGRQLRHMQSYELGFDKDQVLVIPLRKVPYREFRDNYESIKQQLRQIPGISSISSAAAMPGRIGWAGQVVQPQGFTGDQTLTMEVIPIDHDYVKTLGIKIKAGRDLSKDFSTDVKQGVLLNETACQLIGWKPEEALGKVLSTSGMDSGVVVGVMADYHQHGLQTKIGPVLAFINPYAYRFTAARINGKDMQSTLQKVETFWKQRFRGYPFEYFMLDDDFNLQYKTENNLARLIKLFSVLTILVACLGLFGLTAYITMKRTREIGIRKVLGATTGSVASMLSKDFLKLVAIAILISVPVTWWMMSKWLEDFAYRINIPVWAFVLAGISALLIAMVTVSLQAIKAAMVNPVKSLRSE